MRNDNANLMKLTLCAAVWLVLGMPAGKAIGAGLLNADDYAPYVTYFNGLPEGEENCTYAIIRNAQAWDWMKANIPLFDCPDDSFEKIYYYRWWSYRKHIKYATNYNWFKYGVTEWVYNANPNSSAFCHHISEGRWLHSQTFLDQYIHYFYRADVAEGGRVPNLHSYSQWAHDTLYQRYLVTLDKAFLIDLLPDLVSDYTAWENEQKRTDGLYWTYDVRDSMEMGIGGDYKPTTARPDPNQNIRPTINSYMAANALALVKIATLANQPAIAATYQAKYDTLKPQMIAALWDNADKFFKVQYMAGGLCTAREAIGFIPFKFDLAGPEHAEAWSALADPCGFWAPKGLTTAERRDSRFRSHGSGGCEWDGAVWPYATSQTLDGLANVLAGPGPYFATKQNYFDSMITYAQSHQYPAPYAYPNSPYLGEYLDEVTNAWLKGPVSERSRYYNHSTFADLVVTGLAGLRPREDNIVDVNPLVPEGSWDWFCLDQVQYHGHMLTILWDKYGTHYNRGAGLSVYSDDQLIAHSATLERVTGNLPSGPDSQAPTPSTMTWAVAPHSVNRNSISMTATTATDASGVEYYFTCTSGGGHDSGWQASPTYLDFGILRNTAYTYTVKARDASANRNETAASVPATATISSADVIKINFQKSDTGISLTPAGYEMDCGYFYTNRGNGLAYGWNKDHWSSNPLTRTNYSDDPCKTVMPIHSGGVWEIAAPAGSYTVSVTVGDPCSATTNTINAEGVSFMSALSRTANQFSTVSKTVTVSDGKITLDNGSAADKVTRICWLSITPPVLPEVTPPNPNPMSWYSAPQTVSGSSITMTATTATDASGVEYYFTCTAGGGHDSGWQNGAAYTDTGLSTNTAYTYTVKARDKSSNHNATVPSTEATAATPRYDCSAYPESDYNHNCQVDFVDLAAMANTWTGDAAGWLAVRQFADDWLLCNRSPSSECWQ